MSRLAQQPGIAEEMAAFGARWLPDEPLNAHTWLAVGGPADCVRIHDPQRLPEILEYLARQEVHWRLLGGGTNLLAVDEGLRDVVLCWAGEAAVQPGLRFDGNRVEVTAATNLGRTVTECARRNLGGMEGLIGVPGTVGGALRMNAGAYGIQIGDRVRALTILHGSTGQLETARAEDVRFAYRHTSFALDDILLSAVLELPECPYAQIVGRIKAFNQRRQASQPVNERSAGCIFKNPPGCSAGKMIDELGLKGTRIGGAVISELHGNFIVNRYGATAADILKLMDLIRERVLSTYGVELQEEVVVWRS